MTSNRTNRSWAKAAPVQSSFQASNTAGAKSAAGPVRSVKRAQDTLGRLHDLQVLQSHVAAVQASPSDQSLPDGGLDVISRALENDCRHLHAGYVSAIDAELIGQASAMIGAGRDTKEDAIDPAVGVILEVKVGQKIDAGGVLCRLYYTNEEHVDEAAQSVEDAFRISGTVPEERALILEVVG